MILNYARRNQLRLMKNGFITNFAEREIFTIATPLLLCVMPFVSEL